MGGSTASLPLHACVRGFCSISAEYLFWRDCTLRAPNIATIHEAPLMCETSILPRMLPISLAVSLLLSVAGLGLCTAEEAQ